METGTNAGAGRPDAAVIRALADQGERAALREHAGRGDDRAAMWLAVLAARDHRLPDLLDEVHAGTPLAAQLHRLVADAPQ